MLAGTYRRIYAPLLWLPGTLIITACASTQPAPPSFNVKPETQWSFSGVVQAEHERRHGRERFSESIHGQVYFMPDQVVVTGTHGSCTIRSGDVLDDDGRLRTRCDGMSLDLGPMGGEISVPLKKEVEVVAGCAEYSSDDSRSCLTWRYRTVMRTVHASTHVKVTVI